MGVVTSANREHFDIIHRRLDLVRHFRFVLTAEDYRHTKPSPDPYLLGLKRLGLEAGQCLVVEDSPRGLEAARAAGIPCIVLRHELTLGHDFAGALAWSTPWRNSLPRSKRGCEACWVGLLVSGLICALSVLKKAIIRKCAGVSSRTGGGIALSFYPCEDMRLFA